MTKTSPARTPTGRLKSLRPYAYAPPDSGMMRASLAVELAFSAATTVASASATSSWEPARVNAGVQTTNTPVPCIALRPTTTAPRVPKERCKREGTSLAPEVMAASSQAELQGFASHATEKLGLSQ